MNKESFYLNEDSFLNDSPQDVIANYLVWGVFDAKKLFDGWTQTHHYRESTSVITVTYNDIKEYLERGYNSPYMMRLLIQCMILKINKTHCS